MHIRTHKRTKNRFLRCHGLWIRDFTDPLGVCINPNEMYSTNDLQQIAENESVNATHKNFLRLGEQKFRCEKAVIVSDGYGYEEKQKWLETLPQDVVLFLVNGSLAKYALKRPVNFYVATNPYPDCVDCLPAKYFPACLTTVRTYHGFNQRYRGQKYLFDYSLSRQFGDRKMDQLVVDDYRSPVATAMILAWKLGARHILLLCCDQSFNKSRDGSVPLPNGLHCFPQHLLGQDIVDAHAYWLKGRGVSLADWSSGREYAHLPYIPEAMKAQEFFTK